MRFTIDKAALSAAMDALVRVAAHSSVPNMEFEVRKDSLRITATDMMNTLRLEVPCTGEGEGGFLLDGPMMAPAVRELPDGMLAVTVGDTSLVFDWERGSCQMPVLAGETMPPVPKVGTRADRPVRNLVLRRSDLRDIVAGIVPATADKEADLRPVLGGVFFDVTADGVTAVGTDGQMLMTRRIDAPAAEAPYGFLVPKMALVLLDRTADGDAEDVTLHCDGVAMSCVGERYRLASLCIDQPFPAYRSIIPAGDGGRLTADRKDLLGALRRVAALTSAKDEKDTAVFDIRNGAVRLEAQNLLDLATITEMLPCEWSGDDIRFGFRIRRLLTMLSSTGAEKVSFVVTAADRPVLFLPEGDAAARGVIMPVPVRAFVEPEKTKRKKSAAK